METHRRSWGWTLVLLLPVVAGLGWWGGRTGLLVPASTVAPESSADAAPTSDPLPTSQITGRDAARPPAPDSPLPDSPLPDLTLPLRDTWQTLKQRADSGDAKASCRLAAELEYCDQIRQRLDAASAMLADHEAMALSTMASNPTAVEHERNWRRMLTSASEDVLALSQHCEGVPAFSPEDRVRYWRSAALGGNVAAMRHYAVGNAFRLNDTLDNLDGLRLYRSEAETIAKRVGIHMTPHQFRHFCAVSYLESHPEDFHTVQTMLGHGWSKTTLIYAGSSSRRAGRASERLPREPPP